MIRPATQEDVPELVDMIGALHAKAEQPCGFDVVRTSEVVGNMISGNESTVLRSEKGLIGGVIFSSLCDNDWLIASELFWICNDGHGRELLHEFEKWAIEAGANEIQIVSQIALPKASRILEEVGFSGFEKSHRKVVKCP